MTVNIDDTVIVRNTGDTLWKDYFAGKPYAIKPGSSAYIPFRAACTWLGNPATRNSATSQARVEELKHLLTRYGVYYYSDRMGQLPSIEVYEITMNELGQNPRVWMVLDDPLGEKAANIIAPDASDTELDLMKRQVMDSHRTVTAVMEVLSALHPEAAEQIRASLGIQPQGPSSVFQGDAGAGGGTPLSALMATVPEANFAQEVTPGGVPPIIRPTPASPSTFASPASNDPRVTTLEPVGSGAGAAPVDGPPTGSFGG